MARRSTKHVPQKHALEGRLRIPNDGKFAEWPRRSKPKIKKAFKRRIRSALKRAGDD